MGIYVGVLSVFTIILWFREKIDVNNSYTRMLIAFIALLGVSVFSGIRNLYVGIDIGTYGNAIFKSVSSFGLQNTMMYYQRWGDVGYVFLNYIVSFFSKSTHVLLGVQTFIIELSFFLFFSSLNKTKFSLPLSMCILNIIFIPFSFSMLRQSLSIAMVIWIPILLTKKKYVKVIVMSVFAYTFHKTAILALVLCFFVHLISRKKMNYSILKTGLLTLILVLVCLTIVGQFPEIFSIISKQLAVANFNTGTSLSIIRLLLFSIPVFGLLCINRKKMLQNKTDLVFFLFSVFVIIGNLLSGINFGIVRFTFFFLPMYVAFIVLQISKIEKKFMRRVAIIFILVWGIVCLYLLFYRGNVGGVFPYVTYWKNYNPSWIDDLNGWVDKSRYYNLYD